MKKYGKKILAVCLGALLLAEAAAVSGTINEHPAIAYADTNRPATVNATSLNVRSGPGTGNAIVKKLSYGASVTVIGETKDSAGTTWYKIRFASGSQMLEGYASSAYIKFPVSYAQDSNFETYMNQQGFPEGYKNALRTLHAEHPTWVFQAQKTGLDWNEVIRNEAAVGANLVGTNSVSSWKSTEYGAYDWNTGVWTGFDGASWVAASKEIVCYYMDPRNFLNDTYVFQFLLHTYDSSRQTKEGLQSMTSGTFLSGTNVQRDQSGSTQSSGQVSQTGPGAPEGNSSASETLSPEAEALGPGYVYQQQGNQDVGREGPGSVTIIQNNTSQSSSSQLTGPGAPAASAGSQTGSSAPLSLSGSQNYIDIIMNAASQSGVNPYVLCAMIIQEQGAGTSGSISGKVSGYEGYYNYFNVGAYQSGSMSAVTRGLWYASQSGSYGRPWNSVERSIAGGAQYYGENYVKQGQDTFYLKKFNVQGSNLYKHQYMTNVEAAAGEGAKLANAYTDTMKKEALVFKIPVFNNMPETACAKPTLSGSPNNKLSGLEVTGYALTPTFNMNTESYDIIVNPSVERIAVNASTLDSKASVSGTGTIELQSGNNTVSIDVRAENGTIRTYRLNVVRQSGAPNVNVPPGTQNGNSGNQAQVAGPGAPTNQSSGNQGTAYVPGPGAPTDQTSASQGTDFVPGPGAPQDGSGQSNVEVGVGPGGSSGSSTNTSSGAPTAAEPSGTVTQPPVTQAPAETTAPPPATATPETTAPPPETTAAQQTDLKKGDCNGDGAVTILDLMLIKKQILGQNVLSGAKKTAADMNGDGAITSKDADALQKKLLG